MSSRYLTCNGEPEPNTWMTAGMAAFELAKALKTHDEPLVRGHAAWALGQIGERAALQARWSLESDRQVRSEIEAALEAC